MFQTISNMADIYYLKIIKYDIYFFLYASVLSVLISRYFLHQTNNYNKKK